MKLEEPTSSYNCHNYAFVKSEGGGEFWLNSPGDDAFWEDNSFISSSNICVENLKISYQGDHSAVMTANTNEAISKWGAWGLYQHNIMDVPASYLPNNSLSYYIKTPTFSGTLILCTSDSTYTITNLPSGVSVNWSVSPTSLFAVDSGTGSSFTTRATNGFNSGSGIITATITGACGSVSITKDVWVGKPTAPIFDYYPSTFGYTAGEVGLAYQDGVESYSYNVSGGIITQSNSASFTGSQSFINVDPNDLGTSMTITAT